MPFALRRAARPAARTLVAAWGLAALAAGCGSDAREPSIAAESAETAVQAANTVPDFTLLDLRGEPVTLSSFRGKVVLLDFWATWCGPCRMEIPHFQELTAKYGDRGFVVVGVAMDETGADAVGPFVERHEIRYPIVIGDALTAERFGGISALPTTLLLGRDGQLVRKYIGYRDLRTFQTDIEPLL